MTISQLRVAIVGAGPAGIYAGSILGQAVRESGLPGGVSIDLLETLPTPYGLIRYGVAPDHPRIKGIVNSLHEMLDEGTIRFLGNVTFGVDLSLADLQRHYDAVIFATGALRDAPTGLPGSELPGSYGAADFVAWYDGHPDVPRTWPLEAREIAVIGNGNVALDVARVLAKGPLDLLRTDIPANVFEGLAASPVTDVHVFGRRGPAQVKFTPIELRELGEVAGVDVVIDEDGFAFDETEGEPSNNQVKVMTRILKGWRERTSTGAARRLHLHFMHQPVALLGEDRVTGARFERMAFTGDGAGGVAGTGELVDYPVQAVYRAIGYFGSALPGVPFDERAGVIPNAAGRVLGEADRVEPGLYATGWIKRGPVGLIGHTKSDAQETIRCLLEDRDALPAAQLPDPDAVIELLRERGIAYTTWDGWLELDAHERRLGEEDPSEVERERVKVVPREEMVEISRGAEILA